MSKIIAYNCKRTAYLRAIDLNGKVVECTTGGYLITQIDFNAPIAKRFAIHGVGSSKYFISRNNDIYKSLIKVQSISGG